MQLDQYVADRFGGPQRRIAMLKVDTEGFEPHVLESIRPLWPKIGDVLTEVQPHACSHRPVSS